MAYVWLGKKSECTCGPHTPLAEIHPKSILSPHVAGWTDAVLASSQLWGCGRPGQRAPNPARHGPVRRGRHHQLTHAHPHRHRHQHLPRCRCSSHTQTHAHRQTHTGNSDVLIVFSLSQAMKECHSFSPLCSATSSQCLTNRPPLAPRLPALLSQTKGCPSAATTGLWVTSGTDCGFCLFHQLPRTNKVIGTGFFTVLLGPNLGCF